MYSDVKININTKSLSFISTELSFSLSFSLQFVVRENLNLLEIVLSTNSANNY